MEFRVWQHLEDHWNRTLPHHLVNMKSVPIHKHYEQIVNSNRPINPFMSTDESIGDTVSIWTLFSHAGVYVMAIGSLIPAGLGIFCCYFFWCWPVRLAHWPLHSGSMWYTIADDDIEAAPIYRCNGKAGQPIVRPYENHVLHMERERTWAESQQKQQIQSKAVPAWDHWIPPKSRECNKHIQSVVRIRFWPVATSLKQFDTLALKDSSCFTHHQVYQC